MQLLGRAKDASEFVKHGQREATIEIELKRNGRLSRNPIITRIIKKENNSSTYTLNGKEAPAKHILHLAKSMNIQIDNLCQFLPQDRVVEFAQLNPMELLESTQSAVGGTELLKLHEDLKKIRAAQVDAMKAGEDDRQDLEKLKRQQAQDEGVVELQRQRQEAQGRLAMLEQCRPAIQYNEAIKDSKRAGARAKIVDRELKELKALSAPFIERVNARARYMKDAQAYQNTCQNEMAASQKVCKDEQKNITKADDDMKAAEVELGTEREMNSRAKQEMDRWSGKIKAWKRQKAESSAEDFDVASLNTGMEQLRVRLAEIDAQINEHNVTKQDLRDRGAQYNTNINDLKNAIENFGSQTSQQEGKLKTLSADTFAAYKWIRDNQDKFTQPVFGPAMIECSLKDRKMADQIESLLQRNDYKFITCQNQADFSTLQQQLIHNMGLTDVSLRECPDSSLDQAQFRRPMSPEQTQSLGIDGWAIDHLQGPDTVLAQLCIEKSLHRCAVNSTPVSQEQHDALTAAEVFGYAAGQKVYNFIRRKEYGTAGTSIRVNDVRPATVWTSQPLDMGRKAALERDLNEARGEGVQIQTEFKRVNGITKQLVAERTDLEDQKKAKIEEKSARQTALTAWQGLDGKIERASQTVKDLETSRKEALSRVQAIEDKTTAALVAKTEAVLAFAAAARQLRTKMSALASADIIVIEALSDHETIKSQNEAVAHNIAEKEKQKAEADKTVHDQKARARSFKDAAFAVQAKCQELANEGDETFFKLLQERLAAEGPEESLEAEIDAAKATMDLGSANDDRVVRDFERRAREIEDYESRVKSVATQLEQHKSEITEKRAEWEPQLDTIMSQINDAFSDSFARIGCAGQVAVHKASSSHPLDCTPENNGSENGLDFANWAIHISVKFRETEPLSLLDSHRQSGGERAVSTIFYLMALQSLSRAPFRVVDEINQGMDPRNERMVHGRMVDIAAGDDGGNADGSSQYFLITPKLLSGLKYRRGMTVLCIVSGENMPAARFRTEDGQWEEGRKVDFREFLRRAKESVIARGGDGGRRVDSGLGMGSFESTTRSATVGA
jgi:structural maintenance of chromosomes protein 5